MVLAIGMKEVVITPPLGVNIPGQFKSRISTGIRDELYAKAMVVDDGQKMLAFIVLDVLDLLRPAVVQIRERVTAHTGIAEDCVMISATHTHQGAPVRAGFSLTVDEDYTPYMVKKAADAAIMAFHDRREAVLGHGRGAEGDIAFNRRFRMKDGTIRTNPGIGNPEIDRSVGPIDPEVIVLRIDDLEGNPIGVVSNYACHTDTIGGTEYSADFPGEISRTIKKNLGEHVVSLFLQGACGDINHVDVNGTSATKPPDHYVKMGRILAWEILRAREKAIPAQDHHADIRIAHVTANYRILTEEHINRLQELMSSGNEVEQMIARQDITLLDQQERTTELEIQVARLGELVIVGLPAENFVAFGLEIKQRSPYSYTMINELCNGSGSGYICTREAYRQGGYEPTIRPWSRLDEDTGELLVEESLRLLEQINHEHPGR